MREGLRAAVAAAVVVVLATGCGTRTAPSADPPADPPRPDHQARHPGQRLVPDRTPSIVLVLMDDATTDLVQTMPQARAMARDGASWEHSYVVDSLCCVSRSSLLTGQYPHQTGVLTNTANTPNPVGPLGGWEAFEAHGNAERAVNVRLQRAGWTTGYVGKFLNQYELGARWDAPGPAGLVGVAAGLRQRLRRVGLRRPGRRPRRCRDRPRRGATGVGQ